MSKVKNSEDFDVLTFFIIVMVVLTAIVGVFAYVLYGNVNKESRKIKTELRSLQRIQNKYAADKKFRNWIAREREGGSQRGPASEFEARLVKSASDYGFKLDRSNPKSSIPNGNVEELPFDVTIKSIELEPLTKFLFDVEDKWLGAKVKILRLNWLEKSKTWKAEATFSIFRTKPEG